MTLAYTEARLVGCPGPTPLQIATKGRVGLRVCKLACTRPKAISPALCKNSIWET